MGALKYYNTDTDTWEYIDVISGNSSIVSSEDMTGTVNGVNAVFTTSQNFAVIDVFVNGVHMRPGGANDYTITGDNEITFNAGAIPETTSSVTATYATTSTQSVVGSSSFIANQIPSGTVNGSNTLFTTGSAYIGGSLAVYVNGLKQSGLSGHYVETNPSLGTFTFNEAPLTGAIVEVSYQAAISVNGNADTVDGFNANSTPTANTIPVLDSNAQLPTAATSLVAGADASASITYGSGVTATDVYLTKINNLVLLTGFFNKASFSTGDTVLTLPVGYRPVAGAIRAAAHGGAADRTARVEVTSSGVVIIRNPSASTAAVIFSLVFPTV